MTGIKYKIEEKVVEFKSGFNQDFFRELGQSAGLLNRLKEMLEIIQEKLEIKS